MPSRAVVYPERIGRYDVLCPIASGGMATVYLARAQAFGGFERLVALKLVHPHLQGESEFSVGLIDEAKLAARIRHPNVVSVLDVGHDTAGVHLVMDYVEGAALSELLRAARESGQALPVAAGLRIVSDALAGLHAAHELTDRRGRPVGLVHRDFSPQNVLVGLDGIGRLTDFGVAKAATRSSRTSTGTIKGKLAYMAPEQARSERIDRRSDVWAAGVVLWELIAGRRLFTGTEAQVILAIVSGDVPPLSELVPDVPPALAAAVGSALSLDPRRRPATANELRTAIASAASGRFALADTASVATEVERLVGAELDERRQRLQEAVLRTGSSITIARTQGVNPPPITEVRRKSPRLERRSAIAIGLGGMSVGALASFLAMRVADGEPRAPEPAIETVAVSRAAASPPAEAAAPPEPRTLASAREIVVEANLPIASVRIDGRKQPIEPAAKQARVRIPERAERLVAVSSDGRESELELSPDRSRAVARFATRAKSKPSVVRAAPKPDPLSGYNPYAESER